MADQSWDKFYDTAEPDYADLYSTDLRSGSGSEHVDRYVGNMMALADIGENPDMPAGYAIIKNNEDVKSYPFEETRARATTRTQSVLATAVQGQLNTLSELYAQTGDPNILGEAEELTAELEEVEQLPLSSKVGMAALAALKNEEMTDVDRQVLARQAQLAMVGEFMESADLGGWALAGAMIPLRNLGQFVKAGDPLTSEYRDKIRNFRAMLPEEQIQKLPDIMADIWKMSGENAFIFQERILPFIDAEDIQQVYESLVWDAVDAATLVSVTKVARWVKAAMNPARFARNVGANKAGGKIVADALDNEEAAKAAGFDRTTSGGSAFPFGGEGIIPEIVDGLSPQVQAQIVEGLTQGRQALNKIIYDPNLIIKRSPLTEREIAATQQKYLEQFGGNARITESDELGFTVELEVENPKFYQTDFSETPNRIAELQGDIQQYQSRLDELKSAYKDEASNVPEYQYIENVMINARKELGALNKDFNKGIKYGNQTNKVTKKIRYTRDDIGVLDATEINLASPALNSPEFYVNQMLKDAVGDSTVIGFTQQQLRNYFEEAANKYLRGLGKKSKDKVSSVLLQADRDKITRYSSADLLQGVTTKEGLIRLETPEEILAYHGVRDTLDTAYLLKNRQLRRELEFDNWKSVRLSLGDDKIVSFVKPALGENGQPLTTLPSDVKKLYDFATDKVIEVGDANILTRRMQNEGWQLLRSKYPVEVGDELVEYVLARPTNIKRLPDRVLAYRPGYVPRIYKNIFYVAERVGDKVVNGVTKRDYREVKRYFSSEAEAKEWAAIQQGKGETIAIRPGREWLEMHPEFKQDYEAAVFGGLYSGKRADSVIPFGLEGTEAEHIGAFEAMEKALSHVSTRLPVNEFRMGMIRRFLNSSRDPVTGKSYLENPGDWRSEITGLPKTSKEYIALHSFREWMEDQFRIPTAQERYFGALAARMANAIERTTGNLTRQSNWKNFNPRIGLLNLGQKDVFASMRSVAFHTLLGWFNPAQLYVQALGASMAVSVAPGKATYLIPRALAMRAAQFSDNPEVWMRTWASMGLSPNEGEELVRAFRKAGIMDSVRSTADFDAMIHGYGMTRTAFSRAADRGLIFFREGETMVRTYGWLLAHDEFIKSRNLAKGYKLTDKDIDQITKRSLVMTMNLNRANRAFWQKGALSIPTQFMQITAKFIENMSYSLRKGRGNWTPQEKAKILAGQVVMFGAAGIPFGQWAAQGIAEWAGNSEDDFGLAITDPEKIAAIRGGFMEWALQAATGENLAISQRVSIPAGIESFVDMVIRADATLGEKIAGAFGEVPGRFYEAANDLLPIFVGYTQDMEDFDGAYMVVDVVKELAEITSSFRNVHKAWMWEQQKAVLDNKGNPIIPLDPEEDWPLIGAKAMGLEPRAIEDYYSLTRYNSLSKKDLQNVADAWVRIARKYANSEQMGTPEGRRRVQNMISFLNRGLTEEQREKVAASVMNKLRQDDYKVTKELIDAIENVRVRRGDTVSGYKGSLELNTLMVPDQPTDSEDAQNAE